MTADKDSGGARAEVRDSRVTSSANFVLNILQGLLVLSLAFVANNLYQVNLTLAANAVATREMNLSFAEFRAETHARDDKQDERADRIDGHVNAVDSRVYLLEGRNLRGEPRHGN